VTRALPYLEQNLGGTLRAPAAALVSVRTARRALARHNPDLVWVWNGSEVSHAALWALADSNTPMAFRVCEHWFARAFAQDRFTRHLTVHDDGARDRIWGAAMRAINRLPALQIDPAGSVRAAIAWNSNAIREMAPRPATIVPVLERVIHSTSRNLPLLETIVRAPDPDPLIVFLGRRDTWKGADVAVRALRALRDVGHRARLTLAGPAGDDPELVGRVAREEQVTSAVTELAPLDGNGVAALLSRAHVLLVPSTWAEPYPLVSIEGAAARVPLVASSAGGIPEFIRDGVEGLLFAPGDHEQCARAIAATLEDPAATTQRVERARAAAATHSWEAYLDAEEAFVHDAYDALQR
jgi:glycosyltransferase involved in cell wall biosynthesis